jgi:hypothetical protein
MITSLWDEHDFAVESIAPADNDGENYAWLIRCTCGYTAGNFATLIETHDTALQHFESVLMARRAMAP